MQYFKLSEFEKNRVKINNNDVKVNVENLIDNLLDRVRAYYGKAIYVTEGYNPNSKHNGHSIGIAADITTKTRQGNIDIFEYIKTLQFNELSVIGDYEGIHVSVYPKNKGIVTEKEEKDFESDYIVCLDSGHGKDVAGKMSVDGTLREWQWARDIKYRLAESLENKRIALCFDVNPEDTEPGLTVRANRANAVYDKNNKKAIFVSIHVNAAGNGQQWMNARGWSIWTSKGQTESDKLADYIWKEADKIFTPQGLTMRKDTSDGDYDYESNFTVLTKTKSAAVLIENFFMDNKLDMEYLLSESGKEDVVEALTNGIEIYLKTKK